MAPVIPASSSGARRRRSWSTPGVLRYRRYPAMGHAGPNHLRDLRDALREIRALPGLSEPRPGVFWLRRTPFLHFHTTGDFRRAHAKVGRTWGPEIVLPFGASRAARTAFVREIRKRYETCLELQPRAPRRAPTRPRRGGPSDGS